MLRVPPEVKEMVKADRRGFIAFTTWAARHGHLTHTEIEQAAKALYPDDENMLEHFEEELFDLKKHQKASLRRLQAVAAQFY